MKAFALIAFWAVITSMVQAVEPGPKPSPSSAAAEAPAAWPRYQAVVSKEQVNLRLEPAIKARLAPIHPPKGQKFSVQRAADEHWFEILDPDEYRGFFIREDMVTLGVKERL